jgi:hypothetical protein
MAILRRRHDVPALPVHDSLIVPLSRLEDARSALVEAFGTYLHQERGHPPTVLPSVKLKGP